MQVLCDAELNTHPLVHASRESAQKMAYGTLLFSFIIAKSRTNFINKPNTQRVMAQNKIHMPSGTGGLVRYFDEYRSKITIQPVHVIVLIVLMILVITLLHIFGVQLLGF